MRLDRAISLAFNPPFIPPCGPATAQSHVRAIPHRYTCAFAQRRGLPCGIARTCTCTCSIIAHMCACATCEFAHRAVSHAYVRLSRSVPVTEFITRGQKISGGEKSPAIRPTQVHEHERVRANVTAVTPPAYCGCSTRRLLSRNKHAVYSVPIQSVEGHGATLMYVSHPSHLFPCYNGGMKTLLTSLVLVAACAALPANAPAPAAKAPISERWVVVLDGEWMDALAARPARERIIPVSPVLGRVQRLAAVPALDPTAVQAHALAELKRLFANMPVSVRFTTDRPSPEETRILRVLNRDAKRPGLLGMADGIDPLNRQHRHLLKVWLGSLIEAMRFDPMREPTGAPGAVYEAPEAREVGIALGVLIAHEIGHSLGLRHHVLESPEDLPCVMAQGIDKYSRAFLGQARWHYQSRVYLYVVLNRLPLPEWLQPKYAHEAGDKRQCPHCKPVVH